MSQIKYRANLSARTFPMRARDWGRTVIVKQYDNNFNRQVESAEDQDKDIGIPQIYYCHNVMPHAQGFQSVGFQRIINPTGADTAFTRIFNIQDDLGNQSTLGVSASGNWYVRTGYNWVLRFTSAFPANEVYVALCNGISYIFQKGTGARTYNFNTNTFTIVAFKGLDPTKVEGICSAFGFLLAWQVATPNRNYNVLGNNFAGSNEMQVFGDVPVGSDITGPGIPANTYVITSFTDIFGQKIITLSNNCTSTNTTVNFAIVAHYPGGVFWSSSIDETDFVPSLITGAGGGEVQQALGQIVVLTPHPKGFLIYTDANIVAGQYSGNPRYPFDLQGVIGSSGVINRDMVNEDANDLYHYAYTVAGIQTVSLLSCSPALIEISDYLSTGNFEDFDETTFTFTEYQANGAGIAPFKRLAVVSRYIIISYSLSGLKFTHALIYDTITKRLGKIKHDHWKVVELTYQMLGGVAYDPAKANIGLLNRTGEIIAVTFQDGSGPGCMILGKYQFVRQRNLVLQEVEVETLQTGGGGGGGAYAVDVLTALDGRNYTRVSPSNMLIEGPVNGYSKTKLRSEGVNHSVVIQGTFQMSSVELTFSLGAKR
jgi:hypothetical protein